MAFVAKDRFFVDKIGEKAVIIIIASCGETLSHAPKSPDTVTVWGDFDPRRGLSLQFDSWKMLHATRLLTPVAYGADSLRLIAHIVIAFIGALYTYIFYFGRVLMP